MNWLLKLLGLARTLEGILSNFQRVSDQLEAHIALQNAIEQKARDKAATLVQKANNANIIATKASVIKTNVDKMIGNV